MSKDKKQLLLVGGATAIVVGAVAMFALLQQPRSYDDCILENMKGVSSNMVARSIQRACRNKFPEPWTAFIDPDKGLPMELRN